jgi:hypothetical protein
VWLERMLQHHIFHFPAHPCGILSSLYRMRNISLVYGKL